MVLLITSALHLTGIAGLSTPLAGPKEQTQHGVKASWNRQPFHVMQGDKVKHSAQLSAAEETGPSMAHKEGANRGNLVNPTGQGDMLSTTGCKESASHNVYVEKVSIQ